MAARSNGILDVVGLGRVRAVRPSDQHLLTAAPHPDSFAVGISLVVKVGQWWSMLPMQSRPGEKPKFRWGSARMVYTLIIALGFTNRGIATGLQETEYVGLLGTVAAHCFAVSISLLYLRLAKNWAAFLLVFLRAERSHADTVADPRPPGLGRRMRVVTLVVFGCALFEHSFDRVSLVTSSMHVNNYTTIRELLDHGLFQEPFPEALFNVFAHATATFMGFVYIFNDAFVILVTTYISKRVENLNAHLDSVLTEDKDPVFWEHARIAYDGLARLTRDVDAYVNSNILLSFVQNFFFICFQLLYFLRLSDEGHLRNAFRIFSFTYVLIRTYLISYVAAGINDNSKVTRTKLFSVSSRSYCKELNRFLLQAANDEMAVTGCNLFRITRDFILTVAGTIATYEIVLLQLKKTSVRSDTDFRI